jgi:hypothetical protein
MCLVLYHCAATAQLVLRGVYLAKLDLIDEERRHRQGKVVLKKWENGKWKKQYLQ